LKIGPHLPKLLSNIKGLTVYIALCGKLLCFIEADDEVNGLTDPASWLDWPRLTGSQLRRVIMNCLAGAGPPAMTALWWSVHQTLQSVRVSRVYDV